MARRIDNDSSHATSEKTHVQDGPRPERSDHSNLNPQERTPHPTVRTRRSRSGRRPEVAPTRTALNGGPR
jgi:hypothetical protein